MTSGILTCAGRVNTNTITSATSSGFIKCSLMSSGQFFARSGVATGPGQMAVAFTWCGRPSLSVVWVNPIAAHMIGSLTVRSIQLMTNNPRKVQQLTDYGVKVTDRIPHLLPPNPYNRFYLETKKNRSGHYIDFSGKPHLMEQSDPVVVEGMK